MKNKGAKTCLVAAAILGCAVYKGLEWLFSAPSNDDSSQRTNAAYKKVSSRMKMSSNAELID